MPTKYRPDGGLSPPCGQAGPGTLFLSLSPPTGGSLSPGGVSCPRALQVSFPGSVSWLPRKARGLSSPDAVLSVLCHWVPSQMRFCCQY